MRQACASEFIDTHAVSLSPPRPALISLKIAYKKYCILLPYLAAAFTAQRPEPSAGGDARCGYIACVALIWVTAAVRGMRWCAGKSGRRYRVDRSES